MRRIQGGSIGVCIAVAALSLALTESAQAGVAPVLEPTSSPDDALPPPPLLDLESAERDDAEEVAPRRGSEEPAQTPAQAASSREARDASSQGTTPESSRVSRWGPVAAMGAVFAFGAWTSGIANGPLKRIGVHGGVRRVLTQRPSRGAGWFPSAATLLGVELGDNGTVRLSLDGRLEVLYARGTTAVIPPFYCYLLGSAGVLRQSYGALGFLSARAGVGLGWNVFAAIPDQGGAGDRDSHTSTQTWSLPSNVVDPRAIIAAAVLGAALAVVVATSMVLNLEVYYQYERVGYDTVSGTYLAVGIGL